MPCANTPKRHQKTGLFPARLQVDALQICQQSHPIKHDGFSLCIRVDSIVFQVWSIFPFEGNLSRQPTVIRPAILHSCQSTDWSLNGIVSDYVALQLHGINWHTYQVYFPSSLGLQYIFTIIHRQVVDVSLKHHAS